MPRMITVQPRRSRESTRLFVTILMASVIVILFLLSCDAVMQVSASEGEGVWMVVDDAEQPDYPFEPEKPAVTDLAVLPAASVKSVSADVAGEVRAVWISYLEMATLLHGKSETQFVANIAQVFDSAAEYGLNTVIVQVRPFADALYKSDYFPWSYTITGTEGKDPGFDPLQIMVREATARGLRIEAWINPYRVRSSGNTNAFSKQNQAYKWLSAGSGAVIRYNGVISYNPASSDARRLIVAGAVEIVEKYDVDGIHIDDYFYPTTDAAFDAASYAAYQNGGGKLALDQWRRQNVETLIREMYAAVKAADHNVQFGISPQSSVQNNYGQQYLDVEKIAGNSGYCDYICPQIYFGYQNQVQPYATVLAQWSGMVKDSPVRLYVGLAPYKIGVVDTWAGTGSNEWVQSTSLLRRMVTDARKANNYGGFALYRYDSLFRPDKAVQSQVKEEAKNLKAIF